MSLDSKYSRFGTKNYGKRWINKQENVSGRCKTFHHKICSGKKCQCKCHITLETNGRV